MEKTGIIFFIKEILSIIIISLFGVVGVIFTVLYINTFNIYPEQHRTAIVSICVAIITILTIVTITFMRNKKSFIYKLFYLVIACLSLTMLSLYFLSVSGFLDRINSVDEFRRYIQSFGSYAVILFVVLQFLQVVILPIPSFITVGAGVLLFGPFLGSIYSSIGIIIGSIVAYYIGRIFGVKVVKWLVGEQALDKALKMIKGKDKVVLIFMFLFPFFPDDVLCFIAGITTIMPSYFIPMIIVVRLITVFISSYSMNNSIIPYNTWWGIVLWIIFIILTIVATILICKYGDKIQLKFKKKKRR